MMKFLYAPAPLNDPLRQQCWASATMVRESTLGKYGPPTSSMVAKKALANLKRQKSNNLRLWEPAFLQIVFDAIQEVVCAKMYNLGADGTTSFAYIINIWKDGDALEVIVHVAHESLL
jgi:hypothetical protein